MKYFTKLILIVMFFAGSTFAEDISERDNLISLADMIGVDVKSIRFKDDSKNYITVKEFNLLINNERSFDIVKNSGVTTLVINPIEIIEPTENKKQDDKSAVVTPKTFPDFNLLSTEGNKLTLKDFKGKPTLLSFYYSTCIPCIQEVPTLNKLKSNLDKKINFMAVTYESLDVAIGFASKYNFKWNSIIGAEELVEQIGIPGYPAFVLLDKGGSPIGVRVGNATHNTIDGLTSWIKESGISI